jgi:hypothetical protein
MHPIYGPAGEIDAEQAYLFRCGDGSLWAISYDEDGANLPRSSCPEGWQLMEAFSIGVREAMPLAIDPEPVLRGLWASGYYVWREGSNPRGSSQ